MYLTRSANVSFRDSFRSREAKWVLIKVAGKKLDWLLTKIRRLYTFTPAAFTKNVFTKLPIL
jgi:hypothetical protein